VHGKKEKEDACAQTENKMQDWRKHRAWMCWQQWNWTKTRPKCQDPDTMSRTHQI